MTDQSPAAAGAEKLAHFRIRQGPDGSDEVSLYGGPWEKVDPEPVSDDPAVNAVGTMPLRQNHEIMEDETHPDHAAVVEYNRLLMKQLQPMFDAVLEGSEPGRRVIDEVAKITERTRRGRAAVLKAAEPGQRVIDEVAKITERTRQGRAAVLKAAEPGRRVIDEVAKITNRGQQLTDAIAKTTEPNRRTVDEVAKITERGRQFTDAFLKANGSQPVAALAAQHYKELVADALPELPTSTLIELPKADQVVTEPAAGFDQPEAKPGDFPQMSDAVVDLLREQREMQGAQNETLAELVEQQKQLLDVERTKTAAAEKREKAAAKDARHNKVGMWLGIGVGVVGVVVAILIG